MDSVSFAPLPRRRWPRRGADGSDKITRKNKDVTSLGECAFGAGAQASLILRYSILARSLLEF